MTGKQAARFLSLAKHTVQNLRNTVQDYDPKDLENLPTAFLKVVEHIPTALDALEALREEVSAGVDKGKDDSIYYDMMPTGSECKAKSDSLEQLFSMVVSSPPLEQLQSYRGAARELGKGNRVETLLKSIMKGIKVLLSFDEDMKSALEIHVQALVEAIQKVAAIPPSLPDETEGSSINNYGSGFQNVNTGKGPQNNNNASGQQFIGGTFSGFNPSSPPSKSDENRSREQN